MISAFSLADLRLSSLYLSLCFGMHSLFPLNYIFPINIFTRYTCYRRPFTIFRQVRTSPLAAISCLLLKNILRELTFLFLTSLPLFSSFIQSSIISPLTLDISTRISRQVAVHNYLLRQPTTLLLYELQLVLIRIFIT